MDLNPNLVINHDDTNLSESSHMENDSYARVNETPSTGHPKVDMWRNHNFDSGFQTMNHSEAPSIISSLHPSSHLSGMSSMADFEAAPNLSDQQQQKFDGITTSSADGQYNTVRAIPELTNLMKDQDTEVVHKAVILMQNIAKMECDPMRRQSEARIVDPRVIFTLRDLLRDKVDHPTIIRYTLGTLFNICNRQEGIDLVTRSISMQPDIIPYLINHIGTQPVSIYKYAILTLHSILSDKQGGAQSVVIARQANAITHVTPWLDTEKSEKLLPVIVDLIRILCEKNNEQKMIFLRLGGPQKLLMILQSRAYENLLWRSTQLLKMFSNFDPPNLVACGGRQILAKWLAHESPRLVLATLETLRNISDVPCKMREDLLLKHLLVLMNSRHATIRLYAIQIMSNLVANNRPNKEYMCANHAVDILIRSLTSATQHMQGLSSKEAQQMEDYMEYIIVTLRHLCVGHPMCDRVQAFIFRDPSLFLEKLLTMRPVLLKHTMSLLLKIMSQNVLLDSFLHCKIGDRGFVDQLVHILKVACGHLNVQEVIEGVRVKELVHLSIQLLRCVTRDHNILHEVNLCLRIPENLKLGEGQILPLFVIQKANVEENTKVSTLAFIYNLMLNEDMADLLEKDTSFVVSLQNLQMQSQSHPDLFNLANNILKMMMEKRERSRTMHLRYNSQIENQFGHMSMSNSRQDNHNNSIEHYEGAGEQWCAPLSDDSMMDSYCNSSGRDSSKPFNSPMYHSPPSMYPDYHPPSADGYYDHVQPSTSYLPSRSTPSQYNSYDRSPPVYNELLMNSNHPPEHYPPRSNNY